MTDVEIPTEEIHSDSDRRVGLVISILAVLLAVVSALGSKSDNDEIVGRVNASNTWAYFQAKKNRSFQLELNQDLLRTLAPSNPKAEALLKRYEETVSRYKTEGEEITGQAKAYEAQAEAAEKQGNGYDLAEVLLQVALVLSSVTILSKNPLFFRVGLGFSAGALAVFLYSLLALG
jgi:hypothetical protein